MSEFVVSSDEKIEPLIELIDVSVNNDRGSTVFKNLSFTLKPGESIVIIGSPGSGKTVLAELLIGLRFCHKGKVKLFGRAIGKYRGWSLRKVRSQIGGVGGIFGLVPSLSVADNIMLPMIIAGERKRNQKDKLRKMLAEFSLMKQAGEFPGSLTRVESTLVQFARASVSNQPLIIIDEPSAGLDSKTFERIFEFLSRVAISGRSMVIMTSEPLKIDLPHTRTVRIDGKTLV